MLVPAKPPVYPKVPTGNDASMWMQAPVSADDFLSGPKKKPTAPSGGRGLMVALLVTLFVGVYVPPPVDTTTDTVPTDTTTITTP